MQHGSRVHRNVLAASWRGIATLRAEGVSVFWNVKGQWWHTIKGAPWVLGQPAPVLGPFRIAGDAIASARGQRPHKRDGSLL